MNAAKVCKILTCWWKKPWDYSGFQGRFCSQEFLPLWGLFILVLMGAPIMSVWPQGTTYAPYHIAHNPSACREREREKWICQDCSWGWWIIFEICRQFTWVRCIWLLLFPLFCVPQRFMRVCGFVRNGRSLVAYQFHRRPSQTRMRSPVSCSVYSSANRLVD